MDRVFQEGGVCAFVEGLEESHLGDGVALGRGEAALVVLLPGLDGGVAEENAGLVPRLPVRGDAEDEVHARVAGGTEVAMALVKVLIDISALGGVSLHAADRRNTGQYGLLLREKIPKHRVFLKVKNYAQAACRYY